MILVWLLCIVQLSAAVVPKTMDKDAMLLALDGIEGIMYDISEYEDPGLIEYEMSAIEAASPILSLLQMAKKQSEDKDKTIPPKEKYALAKQTLDEVITKLQTVRTRLEKGNGDIHYSDLEKSIDSLKKLERSIRPNINYLLAALRQSMTVTKPKASEVLEVRTITSKTPEKTPVTTGRPLPAPIPEVAFAPIALPALEPKFTEAPTTTDLPVPSTEVPEAKVPYAMEIYKSRKTEFKKYDDDGRSAYPSKWTWKTSSLV